MTDWCRIKVSSVWSRYKGLLNWVDMQWFQGTDIGYLKWEHEEYSDVADTGGKKKVSVIDTWT